MRFDGIYLTGIGTHLPPVVTTDEAVERSWYDPADRNASGMVSVMVAGQMPAPAMAVRAAEVAVRRAAHTPDEFGALFYTGTYHQGPDGWSAPHYVLRHTIGRPITAVEIRQGCLGMIAGIEAAAHRLIADSGTGAVLLATADNFSAPLVDRWRASKLFLLADGAAAAVVSRRPGFAKVLACGAVSSPEMEELHRGGEVLFPPGITVGRSLNFEERSAYWRTRWASGQAPPMAHFGDCVAEAVDRTLAEAGTSLDKVARVCHVGYARGALHSLFLDPLDLDVERCVWEFSRRTGHAGAADPVIGLEHLWLSGEVGSGDVVLLMGAAPGMQVGCAVLEIVEGYTGSEGNPSC